MPPRYAYWTILIDNKPTAFRARDREELQPTFHQLQRKNADVVMKWFARGRVWDTPEQARWAGINMERTHEKRGREWRPGGKHEDPRARFDKRKRDRRPHSTSGAGAPPPNRSKDKPASRQGAERSWTAKPPREGQRPWSPKPPREGQRPWSPKPPREGQRPWSPRPPQPNAQRPLSTQRAARPGDPVAHSPLRNRDRGPRSDHGPRSGQQLERPFKRDRPPERREHRDLGAPRKGMDPPKKRAYESPAASPSPEKIVKKPEPPDRG